METLDDICQLLIIKLLEPKDQLMLFEATDTEATQRWRSNIKHIWKVQQSHTINDDHFEVFERNSALGHYFLSTISPTVQRLWIYFVEPKNLECLKLHKFQEARSLTFCTHYCSNLDNELLEILQIMSDSLLNLEELMFDVLDLEEEYLKIFMNIPKLKKLRILIILEEHFNYLINMRAKDIIKLSTIDDFLTNNEVMGKLINLRQLSIRYTLLFEPVTLEVVIAVLPSLERLDLLACTDVRDLEQFLFNIIANYPSLKILNLCMVSVDKEFFIENIGPLSIALKTRSSPLLLYIDGIDKDMEKREIRSYFKNSNLEVFFETLKFEFYEDATSIFYLDPINKE